MIRGQQQARANERIPDQLGPDGKKAGAASGAIDFKYLLNNLPLDPEKMRQSQDSIERALYTLGKAFQDGSRITIPPSLL